MHKRTWAVTVSAATAVFLTLAVGGCSRGMQTSLATQSSTSGRPVGAGTLTYGSLTDITTLNPVYITDAVSQGAATLVYAPLYDFNRQGRLTVEPWDLAAAPLEISQDGRTYTVKLKSNARWSDGKPVTADDLIFTIETLRNPKVGSPARTEFDKVKSLQKVDAHTVRITLDRVYAPFGDYLAEVMPIPEHVLKGVPASQLQKAAFGRDPSQTVSDGPWRWKAWKTKQYLEFDRSPNYWGPQPHIKKIVYKIYATENALTEALMRGDVDMDAAIPWDQLGTVRQSGNVRVLAKPGPQYESIAFNFDASNFPGDFDPFADPTTRQAIYYVLDRKAMVKSILRGDGAVINSPFLSNMWYDVDDQATQFAYNPAKAKRLLRAAGWKLGPDGVLEKDGHPFRFELQYNAGDTRRAQTAAMVKRELQAVGIQVKLRAIDFSDWVTRNLKPGKFQAVLLAWSLDTPDPDQESVFSSKYFPPYGDNMGWYKNPHTDKLWTAGNETVNEQDRKRVYGEIAKDFSDNPPYVFLYQYGTPMGYSSRVHWRAADAPEPNLAQGSLYHIENWWLSSP
ncbi:ABC transporter substrate-binding protein [Alicyclobacillus shizuokensis]|uniref:ABC transporter substrate-binding protein n=1 Tax=Alicyclobacillus shizuokensis TaxID=392014 RepID=UPI0008331582|nr:ABC transporter substrate-binding protein [Alicyclobacillus shizuokensis]